MKFETQKKISAVSEKIQEKEIEELEEQKTELQKQLENVEALISIKKRSVAGVEEEMKKKEIGEKIGEWKAKQKEQAKEILKKFFEKESASAGLRRDREEKEGAVEINVTEQEEAIKREEVEKKAKGILDKWYEEHKETLDKEAGRFLKESPARESLEIAYKKSRGEFLESKEIEPEEKEYIEKNELAEDEKKKLLDEAEKINYSADKLFEHADEIAKKMKEKGIDVEKIATSFKERLKLRTKLLFDKKFRELHQDYERTALAANYDKERAWDLTNAANNPEFYNEQCRKRDLEKIAERQTAKKPKEFPGYKWVIR